MVDKSYINPFRNFFQCIQQYTIDICYVISTICFFHLWLLQVFLTARAFLQLWQVGILQLWCTGFSLWQLLLFQRTGSRECGLQQVQHIGSVAVTCGLWNAGLMVLEHSSTPCGIFLDQGSNPCVLNWQADFLPLSHQGSPTICLQPIFSPLYTILFKVCTL